MRYHPDTKTWDGSATDLANHARCAHLTQLTRARELDIAEGRVEREPATTSLAATKGNEFETEVVARLRAETIAAGGRFLDLALLDPVGRRDHLAHAMADKVELIAQAPLRSGTLFGYADLLQLDQDSYVPIEIKLARTVKPEHLLQASAYADALAELQDGQLPPHVDVITGDGVRHEHLPEQYVDYVRVARERFDAALTLDLDEQLQHVPEPVEHCADCPFQAHCDARRAEVDHLSQVARIRADQRTKLVAIGITTLAELATNDVEHVVGIGSSTLAQLKAQAALQLRARTEGAPAWEFRRPVDGDSARRGFALLPEPDPVDIYFDFEGYPYHESGSLEYLWGWTSVHGDGTRHFDYLWADDPAAEDEAMEQFLTEVERRRALAPSMHVYHYAPYEITALSRIARRRVEWMDRLDTLLRAGVFVDLYAVVRQSMLIGIPSYSIKQLEPLYGISRAGDELADGGASIEIYEQWIDAGDPAVRQSIIDYNQVDCDSTLELRDWLLARRDEARAAGVEWPDPPASNDDEQDGDEPTAEPHASELLRARLEEIAGDESRTDQLREAARLLSAMPGWGWRIKRQFLGELHAGRTEHDDDDFVHMPEALGALELIEDVQPARAKAGTRLRTYRFPEQVTTLRVGDHAPHAYDPHTALKIGTIAEIDLDQCTVSIRTTAREQGFIDDRLAEQGEEPGRIPTSLVGYSDIPYRPLEGAAMRVTEQLLSAIDAGRDPLAPGEPGATALMLLAREAPRFARGDGLDALGSPPDPTELAETVRRLDAACLVVQGPPGTGKTWTSARLLVALVESGLKVGISSNSHEAIINVLEGLAAYRRERAMDGRAIDCSVGYSTKRELEFGDGWLYTGPSGNAVAELFRARNLDILAGTAWQFTKGVELDVVLVDEAGQLSLLHGTAIASDAKRLVLVGDPQQLPQPSETTHPHGCDASLLEHLFGELPVLPPERAALLNVTRRMHPRICSFISDTYYDGRLTSHESTAVQRVIVPALPELPAAGTVLIDVEHDGNRASSTEEVAAIRLLVDQLLDGGRVVPHPDEPERAIEPGDLIVVAPYNAQRRLLQDALGDEIRVGTVDRFQGREAPIAIVSMTASSREDLPRGLEFLLDPHRMNVAISRARALAVVVASPALRATSATSLREMRLLNDLARFSRISS
jgi:uncharacterized protein